MPGSPNRDRVTYHEAGQRCSHANLQIVPGQASLRPSSHRNADYRVNDLLVFRTHSRIRPAKTHRSLLRLVAVLSDPGSRDETTIPYLLQGKVSIPPVPAF